MLEALLSLSGLGLLYSSTWASWSTSLNVLFFYITWSTLLMSQPPLKIEVLGTLAVRLLFFWIPSLLSLLFDSLFPSLSEGWKIQGTRALPDTSKRTWKVIGWGMANMVISAGAQALVEWFLVDVIGWKSALKVGSTLPLPGGIAWDIVKGFILREVLQYYIHRFALHESGELPQRLHETWQHSMAGPWSAVAHYDHPLPYLLLRFLPVYLPAVLFRFHVLTYFLFVALVSLEESLSHSGYKSLFFSSLLTGAGRRTDRHFSSNGKGNFAPWGVMDWLHDTSLGGNVKQDAKSDWNNHKERRNRSGSRRRIN